jgi:7,8-dihydro-6-hydroxymethylpterin-pyrophosphokinase
MNERAFVLVPLAEIAPHKVSAEQLQSVRAQSINRLPSI